MIGKRWTHRNLFALALLGIVGTAGAAGGLPDASSLRIDQLVVPARGPAALANRTGEYVVTLTAPSLAKAYRGAGGMSKAQQQAHLQSLKRDQDAVAAKVRQLGGKELARVSKALNGIVVEIDARQARELEKVVGVLSVRPLNRYELDLSETVPYIGAKAVQDAGNTGAGVRVAVLDSGIDYTHKALGGGGTLPDYAAAYGAAVADPKNTTLDGLFPTAKVIGGYDFVGESWPNGPLAPDPDPIDREGHGTHVADIIGGVTPTNKGVAPGVLFYAVKVCSAVASSCSGVALLQGVDYALDPNGDGDISDRVDVMNLSLGSSYGQDEDDLTAALNNASEAGVVVVASAGNSADRPYIVGSPSSGKNVVSVAQTQVPSATAVPLVVNSPPAVAGVYTNTATVDWAPVGAGATGDVLFVGTACPGEPALPNLAGKIALIDRGACSVSLKVDRAAQAGAIGVLIGLVASGDAITFSYGGGALFVPTLVITQSTSNRIKANIAAPVNVSISPAAAVALAGSMVGSSSRGPTFSRNSIKPDIGAPGASVSAVAGSGDGTEAFGGTSGAAPMVTGSVALLLKARPDLSPPEVKALLMNTGNTNVYTNPATQPGALAPITRIGGGEVRINAAVASRTAAWDREDLAGSLSFGYQPVSGNTVLNRQVVVRNYGNASRSYSITPAFRYADDAASGAVSISAPASVTVGPNASTTFSVQLSIDPSKLPVWTLNGGSRGGDGFRLQGVEFDGYITIDGGADNVARVAWQVLPHRAADVAATPQVVKVKKDGTGALMLKNKSGVLDGRFDVFALTGQSGQVKRNALPQPGDNFAVVDLKSVGVRPVDIGGGQFGLQFAIDTFGARAHPNYPAEFDIYIDVNRDGTPDFVVYNAENGGFGATGQNVVAVINLNTNASAVFFFADADLNSGNVILTAPLSFLGLTPASKFDFSVYAFDNYFTGNLTDAIEGMTVTLGTPQFGTSLVSGAVAAGTQASLGIVAVPGGEAASPSQKGLLLMYRDAEGKTRKDAGRYEAQAIEVSP